MRSFTVKTAIDCEEISQGLHVVWSKTIYILCWVSSNNNLYLNLCQLCTLATLRTTLQYKIYKDRYIDRKDALQYKIYKDRYINRGDAAFTSAGLTQACCSIWTIWFCIFVVLWLVYSICMSCFCVNSLPLLYIVCNNDLYLLVYVSTLILVILSVISLTKLSLQSLSVCQYCSPLLPARANFTLATRVLRGWLCHTLVLLGSSTQRLAARLNSILKQWTYSSLQTMYLQKKRRPCLYQ